MITSSITIRPPTQYTTAVPTAATSARAVKKIRLSIAVVTPMSRTRPARAEKPSRSASYRPKSFTRSAPPMPNRSVIVVFISALSSNASRVIAARRRPTRLAGQMKRGSRARARRVSRHSSSTIASSVVVRMITLETTEPRVVVNARCAPMTSLLSRLINAPVWVCVKNATGMRWTWSKREARRS